MSQARIRLVERLVALAGEGVAELVEAGDGWPARVHVQLMNRKIPVDLYIARIHSHARLAHELRFQNPAQPSKRPIVPQQGVPILLLGLHDELPVCVAADPARRTRSDLRFSVLFHSHIVEQAALNGWAEYHSKSDEIITALRPELLNMYVEASTLDVDLPAADLANALRDAGFADSNASPDALERSRRAVSRLLRDAQFRKSVMEAYSSRCALSNINWSIVQAAHIYPVSAPGSTDAVTNGIGLSPTHHAFFDRHLIYISPDDYKVQLHPGLLAHESEATQAFVAQTATSLRLPRQMRLWPSVEMLSRRYDWFADAYSWVES